MWHLYQNMDITNVKSHNVGGPCINILCILYSVDVTNTNTKSLLHVEGKVSKLTKEMQAASNKILTNRSSNCSTTSSQILFPAQENT